MDHKWFNILLLKNINNILKYNLYIELINYSTHDYVECAIEVIRNDTL